MKKKTQENRPLKQKNWGPVIGILQTSFNNITVYRAQRVKSQDREILQRNGWL